MEAAKIDWKSIESIFVLDQVYENINAPQFVDLLASSPSSPEDDVAWFCRPDCKHPRTAEDFLKSTPTSKLLRSVSVSKLIGLTDWTRREATNLKRRGANVVNEEDNENQNPNFSTPPNLNQIKYNNKAAIKSSVQKEDEYSEIMLESDEKPPRLKDTHSARDLFGGAGKDLFGKITDFCNELKKMAASSRAAKEREDEKEQEGQQLYQLNSYRPLELKQEEEKQKEPKRVDVLGPRMETMSEKDKERKPLLEVKLQGGNPSNGKSKLRRNKLRAEDAENIPVSLDLNSMKHAEKISPIRMNPPTPQGFSATRDPFKATPSKAPKSSRLLERKVFQEMEQKNRTLREELGEKTENGNASLVAAKEGRTLDVFWFLKPCTLSS